MLLTGVDATVDLSSAGIVVRLAGLYEEMEFDPRDA
jgi:hypothetical protein